MRLPQIAIGIAFLLSACASGSSVRTENLSPTPVSIPTYAPQVLSTATAQTTPDARTVTPTLEPTATPPSLPTLIPGKNPFVYQLTNPSPEGLLGLMDALNTQYGYFGHVYDNEGRLMFDSMVDELSNVLHVTAAETNFYYPDGFPDPQIVWGYYPFTKRDDFPVFPSVYLDSLTNAVFDDFNRHPDHLKDQGVIDGKRYAVRVYPIELDYDPQPEWLVRMDWEEIAALSWLVLDQNSDKGYIRFRQSLPDNTWIPATSSLEVETLQDFTGDGITDVILVETGYLMGTDFYEFIIAQGTKDGFQELRSMSEAVSVTVSENDYYTIDIPPGSKWLTLTLSEPHKINWDCTWATKISYRWPYGNEQIVVSGKETPRTPECSLARAVSLLDPVDDITAVQLLENAIDRFDRRNANQRVKLLFAHYRLAILYALLDQDTPSREQLERIIENSTKFERYLKDNLSPLLKEKKVSAIKLCDSMYSASASLPEGWREYVGATAAVHAYPRSAEIYPPAICPLQDIILDQLYKVDLTKQPIPEKALADQVIPVALLQTYLFPDQAHPASFMLIREKTPYIAGYVPAQDGWKWKILEEFDATEEPPQVFSKDVTGDYFPELAYFQKYKYMYCPENKEGYKVFLTTSAGNGFVSITHNVCNSNNKTFDLADHLPDDNKDGVVDWVADQLREYAGNSALTAERTAPAMWFTPHEIAALFPKENSSDETVDVIDELTDKLYNGRNVSTIRQKLISERNNLNSNDPVAEWQWQRLTYLIAISHEMEGQADQAIETFTSILRAPPQTLWGNLAELHLGAK